jgi:hypothetical protein
MNEIPSEGTPAGDTLAVMMGVAPVLAIVLGSVVKPKLVAFFDAILASGGVIAGGIAFALHKAPGEGTELACSIFGGVAGGLALFMATATAGGHALLMKSAAESPTTSAP